MIISLDCLCQNSFHHLQSLSKNNCTLYFSLQVESKPLENVLIFKISYLTYSYVM